MGPLHSISPKAVEALKFPPIDKIQEYVYGPIREIILEEVGIVPDIYILNPARWQAVWKVVHPDGSTECVWLNVDPDTGKILEEGF